MPKRIIKFSTSRVSYFTDSSFSDLRNIVDRKNAIIITDENVFSAHQKQFRNWNTIVLKAGEAFKVQATVDSVIEQMIEMQADRQTTLVGAGGGVITDLTGYIASIFMRGISFGFIPTSLLAMVDASIGGKNGIDVGDYKNMVGVIRQPSFILQDTRMMATLPDKEWRNGFAEIIKHASIRDAVMFRDLEENGMDIYKKRRSLLGSLVSRNMMLKTRIVQRDEFEKDERRKLNFGHTLGHALETQYELSHGEAISIGMTFAGSLSQQLIGFRHQDKLTSLLEKYQLPTHAAFDRDKVIQVLKMDKKKAGGLIHFILLEKIGRASILPLNVEQIYQAL